MEVTVAALADHANIAAGEKLNVLGIFDTINSPTFPLRHPFMALVLRLAFEYADSRQTHVLAVALRNEDGGVMGRAEAQVEVGPIPAGESVSMNQILGFAGTVFPKAGRFTFEVLWDGSAKARIPLRILQTPPQPPPA